MPKNYPSFDIYPGDYYLEVISTCSIAAQGLWLRLKFLMHNSERCGYLQAAGKPMVPALAARRCGVTVEEYTSLLKEMDTVGWLERDDRGIIFDADLEKQELLRVGARERKHKSRTGKIGKELETKENGHSQVTALSQPSHRDNRDTSSARSKVQGDSSKVQGARESISLQEGTTRDEDPELEPPPFPAVTGDPIEDANRAMAEMHEQAGGLKRKTEPDPEALALLSRANGKPVNDEPGDYTLVEEIALASPAASAQHWTPLSIHGKATVIQPIINALQLEMREQGMDEREAGLWLLKQVRAVTEAVMREANWQRYWTAGRQGRFFENVEYRNTSKYNAVEETANGHGKRRGRTAGNAELVRRALEESERQNPSGNGNGTGGHGSGDPRAGANGNAAGGVQGEPERPQPRGAADSVQPGNRRDERVPSTSYAQAIVWPD